MDTKFLKLLGGFMNNIVKLIIKRGIISFCIYSLTIIIGFSINSLPQLLPIIDGDGFAIAAHIVTNIYGFISGIMGYGDFFEYSGFNIISFIIGGVIWTLLGIVLSNYLQGKDKGKKYHKLSKILIWIGLVIGIVGSCISFIIAFNGDGFAILLIPFLATIFIPIICIGLIFRLIGISIND
jgi:hypothetical protein